MTKLRISRTLSLPAESVTKTFAILAQRRKGKTYTASVMAEEMVKAGLPWVALDPTGAWWGLRAGADGSEKGGLRVYVFGGDHGDLPLERTAGKQIADLVVDHPGHYVLDFSHFESKEAERQLATDFAERFYRRKGKAKAPMHLFVDEADMFVPQRSPRGDQRMLGAFESIVRRGGIRGIGSTLISQRAAVVNKNVLEQIDVLITLRVVGPNDQKAIKAYIDAHGTEAEQRDLMGSLAALKLGEAWIWEPGADLFARIQVRERHTFNSSATPDGKASEPVGLADVDLDALRGKLHSAIERAKAEDPKELRKQLAAERKRVTALQRDLEKRPTETEEVQVEKLVEIPVLANGAVDKLGEIAEALRGSAADLTRSADSIISEIRRVADAKVRRPEERRREAPRRRPSRAVERPAGAAPPAADSDDAPAPKGVQLKMLEALAAFDDQPLTKVQLAHLVGKRPSGGYFGNMLSALKTAGYVEGASDALRITDHGLEVIGGPRPPMLQDEVLDLWRSSLKGLAREMFDLLVEAHPNALTKEELAEATGKEPTGGYFGNMLSSLRSAKLAVSTPDGFQATDDLFVAVS